jgi:hypothetical protein
MADIVARGFNPGAGVSTPGVKMEREKLKVGR